MGLKQFILAIPIIIIYLMIGILDGLKRLFEAMGDKLVNLAFKR